MMLTAQQTDNAREAALRILHDIDVKGAYGKQALDTYIKAVGAVRQHRAFVTELVYGTVRWRLKLDWIIKQFSNIELSRISSWMLNILRLGIYQIIFTDRIPDSAAVNESVKLAKKFGHKASSGFVNAVLRNVVRKRNGMKFPDRHNNISGYLSVMYSHPRWITDRWIERYGSDFTEQLMKSNNSIPDFTIRVNTLRNNRSECIKTLGEEGYEASQTGNLAEALAVRKPAGILETKSYRDGRFVVQDEGAMMVSRVLAPEPGDTVIDMCSAPGGKTTHIAQLMNNTGIIYAWDIYDHKIRLVKKNCGLTGTDIVYAKLQDATEVLTEFREKADRVLADVPCSGLGVIRRKPDIKWARTECDLKELASMQYDILKAGASCLKPGGVLVYSTCTTEPEENEHIIRRFIDENSGFSIDDAGRYLPERFSSSGQDGMIRLFPNIHGVDGFFITRITKEG